MKKRKTNLALWLGLAVSLIGNAWLFLLLVDAGILIDNAQSTTENLWERRQLAIEIMKRDWLGRPVSALEDLARDLKADGVIVKTRGQTHEIGSFLFDVEGGVVIDVRDFDSPPPPRIAGCVRAS